MSNLISIVTPTKNEAQNMRTSEIKRRPKINYEQIIIDNNSLMGL